MSKIAKNYLLNVIYRVSTLFFPFITIPYLSRILGKKGIGIYAFTNSIIQYFFLIAVLGIELYGTRTIAYVRDDKINRSKTFWSIYLMKIITSLVSLSSFFLFLFIVNPQYYFIYLIQSINLLAAMIDISWFFMGLENFKKIVFRDLIIKIVGICLYFIFIHSDRDLWKYTLIVSGTNFIRLLSLWFYMPQYLVKVKIKSHDIIKHIIPNLKLFIPQLASQLYQIFDKTMIGILIDKSEVGIYEMGQRIIKMSYGLITSLGLVMLPRISNIFTHGNMDKIKNYAVKAFSFVNFLAFALTFGFIGISYNFVPWFFGQQFLGTINIIISSSPIIIFVSWTTVLGSQVALPLKREKQYTIAILVGTITNIILNLVFIPFFAGIGASIASVIAKLLVAIELFYFIRDVLPIKKMFKELWKYLISGIIMLLLIIVVGIILKFEYFINLFNTTINIFGIQVFHFRISNRILFYFRNITTTILQFITGIIVYFLVNFIFHSTPLFYILKKIKLLFVKYKITKK